MIIGNIPLSSNDSVSAILRRFITLEFTQVPVIRKTLLTRVGDNWNGELAAELANF
jgi:hypothetical protein